MKKIRVGVVGLGIGRAHLNGYLSHPAAEVAALCDINPGRLQAVADEHRVSGRYGDAREMFARAGLDAVSIATPNNLHAPLALDAFKAGLHVLCEKPMAMSAEEAARMESAARENGLNLMINFSQRFTDTGRALRKQVEAGLLGDIYFGRTTWHRRRNIPKFGSWFSVKEQAGGGPLIDIGIHRLDLALWLMDYPEPVSVSGACYDFIGRQLARREGKVFDVEDLACAMIRFRNGATLMLEASWVAGVREKQQMNTMLLGTRGGLVQRNIGGDYGAYEAEVYTEENGVLVTRTLDRFLEPVLPSYHEFINSIIERRAPSADGAQGLKVMKILDGIYLSAQKGREVPLS